MADEDTAEGGLIEGPLVTLMVGPIGCGLSERMRIPMDANRISLTDLNYRHD